MRAVLWVKTRQFVKNEYITTVVMMLMALILTAIFSTAFSGGYQPDIPVYVDQNNPEAQALYDRILAAEGFSFTSVPYDEGMDSVDGNKSMAFVNIPANFSVDDPQLELYYTKPQMGIYNLQNTLRSTWSEYIRTKATVQQAQNLAQELGLSSTVLTEEVSSVVEETTRNPVFTFTSNRVGRRSDYDLVHYIIGFTLFLSTFPVVFIASEILQDKMDGVFYRQGISGIHPIKIMLGHMLFAFIVGSIQVTALITLGRYVFGIAWGDNLAAVILYAVLFVLVMSCIGLFLAFTAKNMRQLSGLAPIIIISSAMLGGTMWPLEMISFQPLIWLSNIVPHKWAMQAIKGLTLGQQTFWETSSASLVLLGMVLFWFAAAYFKYRRSFARPQ